MHAPDHWNPMFVLNTKRFFSFLTQHRVLAFLVALGILFGPWFIVIALGTAREPEIHFIATRMCGVILFLGNLILALRYGAQLALRNVEQNLLHFTLVPSRSVVKGYLMTQVFYQTLLTLSCAIFFFPFLLFLGHFGSNVVAWLFSLLVGYLYFVMIGFVCMSFFALVRTHTQLILVSCFIVFIAGPFFLIHGTVSCSAISYYFRVLISGGHFFAGSHHLKTEVMVGLLFLWCVVLAFEGYFLSLANGRDFRVSLHENNCFTPITYTGTFFLFIVAFFLVAFS